MALVGNFIIVSSLYNMLANEGRASGGLGLSASLALKIAICLFKHFKVNSISLSYDVLGLEAIALDFNDLSSGVISLG
jgi:hypothetical protein